MGLMVQDVTAFLESIAPLSMAESYDNPGLLVGHRDQPVRRMLLAVDASEEVVQQAVEQQCDLLLVHHPLIFYPIKKVTDEDRVGRRLLSLAENRIALVAAHTNLDSAPGGNIDQAAVLLGLRDVRAAAEEGEIPCLRIGELDKELSLKELGALVKERYGIAGVRLVGRPDGPVKRVGLVTGSGMDFMTLALKEGVDVLITGDITFHKAEEARAKGLSLIDATHFGTDRLSIGFLKEKLETWAAEQKEDLTVLAAAEEDVFLTI